MIQHLTGGWAVRRFTLHREMIEEYIKNQDVEPLDDDVFKVTE